MESENNYANYQATTFLSNPNAIFTLFNPRILIKTLFQIFDVVISFKNNITKSALENHFFGPQCKSHIAVYECEIKLISKFIIKSILIEF